jgi:hypothetical protein
VNGSGRPAWGTVYVALSLRRTNHFRSPHIIPIGIVIDPSSAPFVVPTKVGIHAFYM